MNFDLEDGLPSVSFDLKESDVERFAAFMADCHEVLRAVPTPPDDNPVAEVVAFGCEIAVNFTGGISKFPVGTKLFTSPPFPKAEWSDEDQPLPEDAEILAAHPLKTKRFDLYDTAQRLVGAKRSKFALIDLVNWALWKAENPKADWFNGDVDCDGNELITIRKDAHEPRWDAEGNPLNLEAAAEGFA